MAGCAIFFSKKAEFIITYNKILFVFNLDLSNFVLKSNLLSSAIIKFYKEQEARRKSVIFIIFLFLLILFLFFFFFLFFFNTFF